MENLLDVSFEEFAGLPGGSCNKEFSWLTETDSCPYSQAEPCSGRCLGAAHRLWPHSGCERLWLHIQQYRARWFHSQGSGSWGILLRTSFSCDSPGKFFRKQLDCHFTEVQWILAMNYKIIWPNDLWGFGESPTKWPGTWTVTIQRIDKFDVCFPGREQKSTGL